MSELEEGMNLEEKRLILYVMEGHFEEMMERGIRTQDAREETQAFSIMFEEAGLPMPSVEVISRLAFRRAIGLHAVKSVSTEDFL